MAEFRRSLTKTDIIEELERHEKASRFMYFIESLLFSLIFGLGAYGLPVLKEQYIPKIGFVFDILTVIFIAFPIVFVLYAVINSVLAARELKKQSFIITEDRVIDKFNHKYDPWHKLKGRTKYVSGLVFEDHGEFLAVNEIVNDTVVGDVYYVVSYSYRKKKAQLVYSSKKYNCIANLQKA